MSICKRCSMAGLMLICALGLSACTTNGATTHGAVSVYDDHAHATIVFSDNDRLLIRHYYHAHLPPGLAKRDQLPPGLRKQVVRRGTLPPGLRGQALPIELDRQLSQLPDGYVRLRIAMDVVLLDQRTHLILDIVNDIDR